MKYWWLKNTKGIRYKISSMESLRKFGNWWDSLGLTSDAPVLVHEDGTVSDAEGVGEIRIPSDEFAKIENVWRKYWEFPW